MWCGDVRVWCFSIAIVCGVVRGLNCAVLVQLGCSAIMVWCDSVRCGVGLFLFGEGAVRCGAVL